MKRARPALLTLLFQECGPDPRFLALLGLQDADDYKASPSRSGLSGVYARDARYSFFSYSR